MTKKLSIQEQIADAKQTVESWPDWKKRSTQLEGRDPYYEQTKRTLSENSLKNRDSKSKK